MYDAQTQYDLIPDGVTGVVTVGQSDGNPQGEQILTAVHDALVEQNIEGILIRAAGSSGFFSTGIMVTVSRPGMPSVLYKNVTPETISGLLTGHLVERKPVKKQALCQIPGEDEPIKGIPSINEIDFFAGQHRIVSHRCGYIDPGRIDDALRTGGYQTMDAALSLSPEETMFTLESAGLHGHGGRGQTVMAQWSEVAG